MKPATFESIHCPLCGFSLHAVTILEENAESIVYGIFECRCRKYPVVEGILVLDSDNPVGLQQALRALASRNRFGALMSLLDSNSLSAKILHAASSRMIPFSQVCQSLRNMVISAKARRIIGASTCVHALEACGWGGYGDYFKTRFVSTSFIAGLALLRLARDFPGPALELSCGIGHHAFVISQLFPDKPLTLTDHSFTNLYLAKRFFAPQAECFCLDGNNLLPFADSTFNSVFSSDALHYIDAKVTLMHEVKRIIKRNHVVLFSHLHNCLSNNCAPGSPLSGEEWKQRAAFSHMRLLSEKSIFEDFYLSQKLNLADDRNTDGGVNAFSLVASDSDTIFRVYENIAEAYLTLKGAVTVNFCYRKFREDAVGCHYMKQWPTAYLKTENALIDSFLPESFVLSRAASEAVKREDGSCFAFDEIQQLIRKFLIIHIPPRYC
ncbi:MAG TPA: class I SAM-dependent methyltransferase [Candidatus Omnitrophota bacterium]|nr:class I SAM-dependent methyltransferase [Candidatus Omnitrophota bacterium]HPT06944.1 class I SAM-dependent methyltransferase [Candidatus Omnitrophota bacterium]